jgi:hypothetical protein
VIDSEIQEEHVLLEPGIDKSTSHCFLPGKQPTDVADYVSGGGHGTRVAGAVLHGEEVSKTGVVQFETWVQNARVLDDHNAMPIQMMPPAVVRQVVRHFHEGPRNTGSLIIRSIHGSPRERNTCRRGRLKLTS